MWREGGIYTHRFWAMHHRAVPALRLHSAFILQSLSLSFLCFVCIYVNLAIRNFSRVMPAVLGNASSLQGIRRNQAKSNEPSESEEPIEIRRTKRNQTNQSKSDESREQIMTVKNYIHSPLYYTPPYTHLVSGASSGLAPDDAVNTKQHLSRLAGRRHDRTLQLVALNDSELAHVGNLSAGRVQV